MKANSQNPSSQAISRFEARVAEAIGRHALLERGRPVVVAVSGGADSVALLAALTALGHQCVAAHCNFHLRGEESNRDMRSVQALCATLGADLYVRDCDVDSRRRATGESVEMACREIRYAWFAELLDRLRAQAIAVGHHRQDNAETFFLNLLRGSGIAGLSAMRPRNGYVVRPLLDLSRADIEAYLQARGIPFVVDSTNLQSVYSRNRLRNIVLPCIEQQFPGALSGILASIAHLSANKDFYDACMAERSARYFDGSRLQLAALVDAEPHARLILFETLKPLGFNISQVDSMIASARSSGLSFAAGAVELRLDRGVLTLAAGAARQPEAGEWPVSLARDILQPAHVLVSEHPIAEFKPERDSRVAYFDAALLAGSPRFALRHWRKGDRMAPYGMRGTKLLSDIFAQAKLDARAKSQAWILTRNGEIIWALGLRAGAPFSLTPDTRRYLRLEFRP